MSVRKNVLRLSVAALAAVSLVLGVTGTANAANGPADDRMVSTPTGWWTYQSIDAASLGAQLSAHNARLTDLRVMDDSPLRFSATMVHNTGAYASGSWWYYGLSMAQVNMYLAVNNARLITSVRYGGGYAVVMVPNTGANAKSWWWVDGTVADLQAVSSAHNARPITLSTYASGGSQRYVSIMVSNTGTDAYSWWWYFNINSTTLESLQNPYTSVVDLSVNATDTFNAVLTNEPSAHGVVQSTTSWFPNTTALVNYAVTYQERPTLVTSHVLHGTGTENGKTEWVTVLRDNY